MSLPTIRFPPGLVRLLEVFQRTVPDDYFRPIAQGGPDGKPDDSFAIFRAIARILEAAAQGGNRSLQARYFLPNSLQSAPPASSGRPAGIAAGTVVLDRVGPYDDALLIEPGEMALVFDGGPNGQVLGARQYRNATEILWNPGESGIREVRFVADVLGFVSNLTFVEDPDGKVPSDLIQISNQSFDKANEGASLLFNGQTVIQDSGTPDVFAPSDVGLYLRIDAAATPELVGVTRKIVGFEWPEVEIPSGSGRYPRRVFLEDTIRKNAVEAIQDDGGVFTDYTVPSTTAAPNDVPIFPDPFVVGDAFYFGYSQPFQGLTVRIDTPGEGDWEVSWEYWNGATWELLADVDDPTNGFKPPDAIVGEYTIGWQVPLEWDALLSPSGSGITLFFVRARVSVFTASTVSPVAGRLVYLVPQPLNGLVFPVEALLEEGGGFTDYTPQAASPVPDDVPLLPAAPVVGDALYLGEPRQFSGVEIRITTPGEGEYTLVWEYFTDGGVWAPLGGLIDRTDGYRQSGVRTVSWDVPDDWAEFLSPITAETIYFVRARLDSLGVLAVQPLAGQIRIAVLLEDGTIKWTLLDFREDQLGLSLGPVDAFSGGSDNDLFVLGDGRGVYQQQGESDDVFRDRASRLAEVVTPIAILNAVNRALRPLGFQGQVKDVQFDGVGGGYYGIFADLDADLAPDLVGACDLYGPGDAFPKDFWFQMQSIQEAYGWFLVILPFLGEGDFGVFADDGPVYFDEIQGVYYGPAFSGFMDGDPIIGNSFYRAIYSAVEKIKAGGVGFTLVRVESLTLPPP